VLVAILNPAGGQRNRKSPKAQARARAGQRRPAVPYPVAMSLDRFLQFHGSDSAKSRITHLPQPQASPVERLAWLSWPLGSERLA
jgi:hypothetical protein